MRLRGSAIVLLLLLLSSCSLLQSIEQTNQRRYVHSALDLARRDIAAHVPDSLPLPPTLCPIALHPLPELDRAYDIAYGQGWRDEVIEIAFATQRVDVVLHFARENSSEYLNSLLLIGHAAEALRLIQDQHLDAPSSTALAHLLLGDTATATRELKALSIHADSPIRLRACRQLSLLPSGREEGLRGIVHLSPSYEERNLAASALGELHSLSTLTAHAHLVLSSSPSWLREYELLRLRPLLLQQNLWPLLYDVHHALPPKYHSTYPYSMLTDYAHEIALLRAYEQPETLPQATGTIQETSAGSFRELYGNVRNVNNWAMTYHSSETALKDRPNITKRPSKEEYNKVLTTLGDIFR